MTNQEAFDIATIGVLRQGGPSTTDLGTCQYRGENDRKCGVGQLISDVDYYPGLEGAGAGNAKIGGVLKPLQLESEFLRGLQCAHDNAAHEPEFSSAHHFMRDYLAYSLGVAEKFGLDMSAVNAVAAALGIAAPTKSMSVF